MNRDRAELLKMADESFQTGKLILSSLENTYPGVRALGHSLVSQYETEILTYLLYLAQSAGGCNEKRAHFINVLLTRNFSAEDYNDLIKRLDLAGQNFSNLVPVCLKAARNADEKSGNTKLEHTLIRAFDRIGECARLYSDSDNPLEEMDQRIYTLMLSNWMQNEHNKAALASLDDSLSKQLPLKPQTSVPDENRQTQVTESAEVEEQPAQPEQSVEEILEELNSLVGLEAVKEDVTSLINLLKIRKIRRERDMKDIPVSMHLVFTGNPGTGKTTVARILARLYKALGALSKGQLVEVDRPELVGGYVGQTAIKTQEVCDSALGGVLFIDEAYSLSSGKDKSDFGYEAINTLLVEMENHRDDLAVIVAGYPDLMEQFLQSNPGLKSRFNKFIQFEDYTGKELMEIFEKQCSSNGYQLTEEARSKAAQIFDEMYQNRDDSFANGRSVRNFFEKVMVRQANRLAAQDEISDEELLTLQAADLDPEVVKAKEEQKKKEADSQNEPARKGDLHDPH